MFKQLVQAVRAGRSPLLLTGVEDDRMGRVAMIDGDAHCGDAALLQAVSDPGGALPRLENGVLIERIVTAPELVLCGGGHVSMQVAKIAKICGFSVTVIDDRPEFANVDRFPEADQIRQEPFCDALQKANPGAYYVIVTRGHKDDRGCLTLH